MGKSVYPYECKTGLYVAFVDKAFVFKVFSSEKHPNSVNLVDTLCHKYGFRTYFDMIDLSCSGIDNKVINNQYWRLSMGIK